MRQRVAGLVVVLSFVSGALYPCGGGAYYDVSAPLVALPSLASRIVYPSDYYEVFTRDEVRFIHGLSLADSAGMAVVDSAVRTPTWDATDTAAAGVEVVPMHAFDAAITRNDLPGAEAAAKTIVRELFETPAPIASPGAVQLRRAVELLDLAPALRTSKAPLAGAIAAAGAEVRRLGPADYIDYARTHPTSPRIASVRMRALKQAFSARIPNGWVDEIRKAVPAAAFDSMLAEHDAWLRDYPTHPLAPFVRVARVRLWYFADNRAAAWRELLALYAIAPQRIAYEMRYLLVQGFMPPDGVLTDPKVPAVIRAALVGNVSPTRAEWSQLWELSRQNAKAPWAENLQERLLAAAANDSIWADGKLPPEMPAYRPGASELWRQLWAVTQLRAGHSDLALALATPNTRDSTGNSALILARAHLQRREWGQAIRVASLDTAARIYLVNVLAPDSALGAVRTTADAPTARLAAYALAARHAAAGDWTAASGDIAAVDRVRSALFTQAAGLVRDTSAAGHLAFARWFVAHNQKLFKTYIDPVIWYRSVGSRWRGLTDSTYRSPDDLIPDDLPWKQLYEARAIDASLRAGAEHVYALREYRLFFERTAAGHPQRKTAVREADAAYRSLMDYGHAGGYWEWVLPNSAEARAIREAGRAR